MTVIASFKSPHPFRHVLAFLTALLLEPSHRNAVHIYGFEVKWIDLREPSHRPWKPLKTEPGSIRHFLAFPQERRRSCMSRRRQ